MTVAKDFPVGKRNRIMTFMSISLQQYELQL